MQRPGSSGSSGETVLSSPAIGCSLSSRWGPALDWIFLLSAAVTPELVSGVQNFTAHNPSGNPAVVIARLRMHPASLQAVCILGLPARSRCLLLVMHFVIPISSGLSR